MRAEDVLKAILDEHEAGRRVALCAVVATRGSTPQPTGTIVAVNEAAAMIGTLGGGCMEADVRRAAFEALSSGHGGLTTFHLDDDTGANDGMICGGQMDVAIAVIASDARASEIRAAHTRLRGSEPTDLSVLVETQGGTAEHRVRLEPAARLVVAGAGHIGKVLADLALRVGFDVTVIDDRAKFANATRFPPPMKPVAGPIAETLRGWPIDPGTSVVIVTRGHRHDQAALAAVVGSKAGYIGMIGSRRKIKVIYDELRWAGVADEPLQRVHAPIGLDIGAVTAEEIAVAIVAELISVRRAMRADAASAPRSPGTQP